MQARQIVTEGFEVRSARIRVAMFDLDGTIRETISGRAHPTVVGDQRLLPGVASTLGDLVQYGYFVALLTNQGGVRLGYLSEDAAEACVRETVELIQTEDARATVHYFDLATDFDHRRKPAIGMYSQLVEALRARQWEIDRSQSFYVGDRGGRSTSEGSDSVLSGSIDSNDNALTDEKFAARCGVPFFLAKEFFAMPLQKAKWAPNELS